MARIDRRSLVAGGAALLGVTGHAVRAQPADFGGFLRNLRQRALQAGVSPATYDRFTADLVFDPAPVAASRRQGEFSRPFWDYLAGAVSDGRIRAGQAATRRAADSFLWIERTLGVDREVVAGIWGMESNYGARMGSSDVLRSTASLAAEQVRGDFYVGEFIAALKILDEGHVPRAGLVGSWAGAMGQPQFMPSSFLKYALDADGDGRKNIWTSTRDALASAANHLKVDGWVSGLPWGFEVILPAGFDLARYGDRMSRHDFALWRRLGVTRVGAEMPARGGGGLFLPTGFRGPAFLVTDNFEVIRQYNTSDAYAVGVGHLGDRIFGGPPIRGTWPRGEEQLTNAQLAQMQRMLQAKGHDVGRIDGRLGWRMRRAVQAVQRDLGLPPDGHPTPALLARMR